MAYPSSTIAVPDSVSASAGAVMRTINRSPFTAEGRRSGGIGSDHCQPARTLKPSSQSVTDVPPVAVVVLLTSAVKVAAGSPDSSGDGVGALPPLPDVLPLE